jgi:2,3-bisphosphoglycerate-independent phosphoglycerate mutase
MNALIQKPHISPKRPVVLAILDGVGVAPDGPFNAVQLANTPTMDRLFKGPMYTTLKAHGTAVGMPSDDDMGNSEVGHNALGAGRVFSQGAQLVQEAIASEQLFNTPLWHRLTQGVIQNRRTFHLIGLVSDGNVHSHTSHLNALLDQLIQANVLRVRIHALLDGRDVPARSALPIIEALEETLATINQRHNADYKIASGGGRMIITMDRYGADWGMVERGWHTHVLGKGPLVESATQAIRKAYQDPTMIDQYIPPFVVADNHSPVGPMVDDDSVVLFNFRGDRAIEISMAFENELFSHFDRIRRPKVVFAGMMQYDGDLRIPQHYLVSPPQIEGSVADHMCANGIRSLAISETQKFGHVTFFWNGNKSGKVNDALEDYVEIKSLNLPFNEQPAMKATEITTYVCEHITNYDFIRINYPNGDMVGHTGDLSATIAAIEAVDSELDRLDQAVKACGGTLVVVADHGNADDMTKTAHTLNPVPFVIVPPTTDYSLAPLPHRGLSNVAATLCMLLGFDPPSTFDPSLIEWKR